MSISYKININGVTRDMTDAEKAGVDAWQQSVDIKAMKLADVRKIRNRKLSETDYLGVSDNTMSSDWIAKRKSWRDIPQDYSEDKYDELLARDEQGKLAHTVWEKL